MWYTILVKKRRGIMGLFDFIQKERLILINQKKIKNSYYGFKRFIEIYQQTRLFKNEMIVLDFVGTEFMDGNLCAVLGAIISDLKKRNNRVGIRHLDSKIAEVLYKNGFLDFYNLGKHHDKYATTVKYFVFKTNDGISFQKYLDDELFPKLSIKMTDDYRNYLSSNLDEIYQNARQHGNTDEVYVCGQWYPKDQKLKFTLVDMGVTIPQNVKSLHPQLSSNEAISWATKEGTTTKDDKNYGGRGLFDLSQFILKNGGTFHIISDDGYWGIVQKKASINPEYEYSFPGTIINLQINLRDDHIYGLDYIDLLSPEEMALNELLFD